MSTSSAQPPVVSTRRPMVKKSSNAPKGDVAIQLQGLQKHFKVPVREEGMAASFKSLFHREYRTVKAVDGVDFALQPGEIVGFLGANGAGKTTTLKMLSGLLYPSGGKASVMGYTPWKRENEYLRQIALVMGQRNQLKWDIPAADSFALNRIIYKVPEKQFKESLDEMIELLDLSPLLEKPVRSLSLGERMKCEIASALLHRPKVVFLDEPTIGLDVAMQRKIRDFIRSYNVRYSANILLTSHYMADVEALCERIIVIHQGILVYDGKLVDLVASMTPDRTITVRYVDCQIPEGVDNIGNVTVDSDGTVTAIVEASKVGDITARLIELGTVADLAVHEPQIESTIEKLFAQSTADIAKVRGSDT